MWVRDGDICFEVKAFSDPRETWTCPFFGRPKMTGYHIALWGAGANYAIVDFQTKDEAYAAQHRLAVAADRGSPEFIHLKEE